MHPVCLSHLVGLPEEPFQVRQCRHRYSFVCIRGQGDAGRRLERCDGCRDVGHSVILDPEFEVDGRLLLVRHAACVHMSRQHFHCLVQSTLVFLASRKQARMRERHFIQPRVFLPRGLGTRPVATEHRLTVLRILSGKDAVQVVAVQQVRQVVGRPYTLFDVGKKQRVQSHGKLIVIRKLCRAQSAPDVRKNVMRS
ncbi:hypothetical protein CTA2_6370 [Colletotrichum tanaceti]|nr:hypothetical protein CTA2_6370 [Colletotrichum tanaceti]